MGCRELDITSYYRFVGPARKSYTHPPACYQKTAYSRFFHTVISNYRYYSPELGRWTKRDDIEEIGGMNLYAFVNNDPINKIDFLGLEIVGKKEIINLDKILFGLNSPEIYMAKEKVKIWDTTGKLEIMGSKNKQTVKVVAMNVSTKIDDSSVKACYSDGTWDEFTVTIIRPYKIERTSLTTVNILSLPLLHRYKWKIVWTLYDQFMRPMKRSPISESITEETKVDMWSGGLFTGSSSTNLKGQVTDAHHGTFKYTSGFRTSKQRFFVGNYYADIYHTWKGTGSFIGGTSAWFR